MSIFGWLTAISGDITQVTLWLHYIAAEFSLDEIASLFICVSRLEQACMRLLGWKRRYRNY